jgi:hypothetical protein
MVYQCYLRLTARLKSGGPSLGRSPDAHKQRRPVNQDQIQICGEIGSTQFLEQGFPPCSFFLLEQISFRAEFSHHSFFQRCIARTAEFTELDQSDFPCPVPFAKIFLFPPDPNQIYIPRRLVPSRGVSRSSRTRGGMRWTRQRRARGGMAGRASRPVSDRRRADERRFSRTAKSCGPDASTPASS